MKIEKKNFKSKLESLQTHLFTIGSANKDVGFQAQLVDTVIE